MLAICKCAAGQTITEASKGPVSLLVSCDHTPARLALRDALKLEPSSSSPIAPAYAALRPSLTRAQATLAGAPPV
eukprot:1560-Heterococcus_DN1.PRE.2